MTEVQIILPVGMLGASEFDSALDTVLRAIAVRASSDPEGEWAEKYGTDFENDEFMMHPFCWCENEGNDPGSEGPNPRPGFPYCPWCTGCNCENGYGTDHHTERRQWLDRNGNSVGPDAWFALPEDERGECVHGEGCIYANGGRNEPNFRHKPSGFEVSWYKYIGRGVETEGVPPADLLERCLASIDARP